MKWVYNANSADAQVFHAVWTDNRDVMPPPAKITTPCDVNGDGVIEGSEEASTCLERPNWSKYCATEKNVR